MEKYLTCPITKCIFREPIITASGKGTFERQGYLKWHNENTHRGWREEDVILIDNTTLKKVVDTYIAEHPEKQMLQYKIEFLENKFMELRYAQPQIEYLKGCADLNQKDKYGNSPIRYAVRYSDIKVIKYLISLGVDLNCANNNGVRPIHVACEFSNPEVIRCLMDCSDIDLECADAWGVRPIHVACNYSTYEIILYMINKKKVCITPRKKVKLDGFGIGLTMLKLLKMNPNITDQQMKALRPLVTTATVKQSPDNIIRYTVEDMETG